MENNKKPQWKVAGNGLGATLLVIHLYLLLSLFFDILVPSIQYDLLTVEVRRIILVYAFLIVMSVIMDIVWLTGIKQKKSERLIFPLIWWFLVMIAWIGIILYIRMLINSLPDADLYTMDTWPISIAVCNIVVFISGVAIYVSMYKYIRKERTETPVVSVVCSN